MSITRAVVRETGTMVRRLGQHLRTAPATTAARLQRVQRRLRELRPIVAQVLHQTRARVLGGDTHVAGKVVSVFEPHTAVIRKGKMVKPTEFGNLITNSANRASDHCRVRHSRRPSGRSRALGPVA